LPVSRRTDSFIPLEVEAKARTVARFGPRLLRWRGDKFIARRVWSSEV
jgi:hypothetical protein